MKPDTLTFAPPPGLRSAFLQSALASKRPAMRLWHRRGLDLEALSTRLELSVRDEQGEPVRLVGFHTPQSGARARVLLIHGWEGCHQSSYLYAAACSLHQAGCEVFRLNLRDHGHTHGLNRGMFHSARLQEVIEAAQQVEALRPALPLVIVGFSLGGNFALRLGLHGPAQGLKPLRVLAVSPAIDPGATLRALDQGPALIHRYFINKWHATLRAKAAAWPGVYDFAPLYALRRFTDITRAFVEQHTEFDTLEAYLARYTLRPAQLIAAPTPTAILTAADDSVIPIADFEGLSVQGAIVDYTATRYGGHCGFIENYRLEGWAERWLRQQVERALGG